MLGFKPITRLRPLPSMPMLSRSHSPSAACRCCLGHVHPRGRRPRRPSRPHPTTPLFFFFIPAANFVNSNKYSVPVDICNAIPEIKEWRWWKCCLLLIFPLNNQQGYHHINFYLKGFLLCTASTNGVQDERGLQGPQGHLSNLWWMTWRGHRTSHRWTISDHQIEPPGLLKDP